MKALDLFFALPFGSQIGFGIQIILLVAIVAVIIIRPFKERLG